VDVEDVTREGFPSRRPSEEKGKLAIGVGVLGEIVIDDERVLTEVPKVLGDRRARVGS
jgi:hypothetical protein